jgi:hypothetical protein
MEKIAKKPEMVVTVRQAHNFDLGKHHVFPIPDKEIRKSKNQKQNKGY